MTVKVSHPVAGLVVAAILLGAAFSFGMKWSGAPEAQTAAVAVVGEEVATTSEDVVEEEVPEGREMFDVVRVIDGDTIAISINGKTETVRLIGIDTPETVDTRVEVQCFGKESSDKMKSLLNGRKVYYEIDEGEGERDKYKRLLAYIFRDDGLFVNKHMIAEGFAYEYTYDTDYEHQAAFNAAEAAAKTAQKGLWKPNACPKPAVKGTTTAAPKKAETPAPPPAIVPTTTESAQKEEPQKTEPKEGPKQEEKEEEEPAQSSGTYTCSSNKYNCSDFKTHAEAQSVFDQCGGVDNDVHKLDNNKDGEACESLP